MNPITCSIHWTPTGINRKERGIRMEKLLDKRNQKGSTLIMVIICLAFLGILGSLMLSVSMVNYQMKSVQNSSKSNFYLCEKALDEIKAGLEEMTASAIQEEYELVLKRYVNYSILSEEERNTTIRKEVIGRLLNKLDPLTLRDVTDDDYKEFKDKLEEILLSCLTDPDGYSITLLDGQPLERDESANFYLLIKNVRITYLGAQNYETSITTDLRITIPSFTLTEGESTVVYGMEQPYEGYALAADDDILSENEGEDSLVNGSIYAGNADDTDGADGIIVRDTNTADGDTHTVAFTGSGTITTRGSIRVEDSAGLTMGDDSERPFIWADSLITDATNYAATAGATVLNVNAICLIKDDLTLEGRNSSVTLKGAYIGYSNGADITGKRTSQGSAMIINGAGSSLILKDLSSLLLAGRAHISIENSVNKAIYEVMTGESLSFKSNQRAYLVPGAYIMLKQTAAGGTIEEAKHNPITFDDLYAGEATKQKEVEITNIDLNEFLGITGGASYLDSHDPYRMITKQTTLGERGSLYYYFLNFASGKAADRYLTDYMREYPSALQLLDAFSIGEVSLPSDPDSYSAGNLMSYVSDDGTSPKTVSCKTGLSNSDDTKYGTDALLDSAILAMKFTSGAPGTSGIVLDTGVSSIYSGTVLEDKTVAELSGLYFNMTHYLYPKKTSLAASYEAADPAIVPTIKKSGMNKVIADYGASSGVTRGSGFIFYSSYADYLSSGPVAGNKYLIVTQENVSIADHGSFQGILITSGEVSIGGDARIKGMIVAAGTHGNITVGAGAAVKGRLIATGDIILGKGCNIDNIDAEDFLKDAFSKEADLLWEIFADPSSQVQLSGSGAYDQVNIKNLVTSENWRNY